MCRIERNGWFKSGDLAPLVETVFWTPVQNAIQSMMARVWVHRFGSVYVTRLSVRWNLNVSVVVTVPYDLMWCMPDIDVIMWDCIESNGDLFECEVEHNEFIGESIWFLCSVSYVIGETKKGLASTDAWKILRQNDAAFECGRRSPSRILYHWWKYSRI